MDVWSTYDAWNSAIADVVFPELDLPEPVYLDFEDDVLEGLSARMSVDANKVELELGAAVARTLPVGGPPGIFARHMARLRDWVRAGRTEPPPFLALLGSFCLAAERMAAGDGMSSANYFGRLHEVLGWEPDDRRLDQAYRHVAERLWGEHNRWLVEQEGVRGLPTAFALTHRYVGLTLSQALVRSADRERLKEFFRQYGFSPGAEVAPAELALVLDSWMSQRPCPVSSTLERLWKKGQARDRISQAAAVALAGWDGSVHERRSGGGGLQAQRGHLALTLEVGGFPRKRFALQALVYLPQPRVPRDAEVLTATPTTNIELVPEQPGALGLGRGSSLHAGDILEGVLQIRDSLSGQTLERRPRRLVLFREDELSRRWVESAQAMLGDDVRLLVHDSLADRLRGVLEVVARPGWQQQEPYPGQPEGWTLFTGIEVFSHPGDLVKTQSMDDLAPLVPLTSSQLKVAGGFALPGQVRGKWHSWAPPEVRAISDAPNGFRVRLTDLHRFVEVPGDDDGTLLEEWTDEGSGVLVQPLSDLELEDGDYRLDLLPTTSDEPLASTTIHLRSSDTPDHRQWALLEGIAYGEGVGALGVEAPVDLIEVRGLYARGNAKHQVGGDLPPSSPRWNTGKSRSTRSDASVVRLTVPDADSCLYTGRHREQVDTVPTDSQGKPLEAWSFGRCSGCGLVRRYPTRLRKAGFERSRARAKPVAEPATTRHDVTGLPQRPAAEESLDWSIAFDALLHVGGGSWAHLERVALQVSPSALFVDQFARTLEALGHVDVRRDSRTLEPKAWEVTPTVLAGTEEGYLMSGHWPGSLYSALSSEVERDGGHFDVEEPPEGPASYYVVLEQDRLEKIAIAHDVPVVSQAWRSIADVLPPLSTVRDALPRQPDSLTGDASIYRPIDNGWSPVRDFAAPGAYRLRRFTTVDIFRTEHDVAAGVVARCTVQLGKHLAAQLHGLPLMAYDRETKLLVVPLGADLPGLYGRAAVAASGRAPTAEPRLRRLVYHDVPSELAAHLFDLFNS